MNKICTSLEQSQKLIELGIDIKTADMDYIPFTNNPQEYDCIINVWNNEHEKDWIPAWSLTALIELMPYHIIENNIRYAFKQYKGYNSQGETYRFEYVSNFGITLYETYYLNNLVDAAFEMVCWLKENKKI